MNANAMGREGGGREWIVADELSSVVKFDRLIHFPPDIYDFTYIYLAACLIELHGKSSGNNDTYLQYLVVTEAWAYSLCPTNGAGHALLCNDGMGSAMLSEILYHIST